MLSRPTSSAWRRSILAPIAWKVPSQGMPFDILFKGTGNALFHLARCLVGECDGEDFRRPGFAGPDQMGEPRRQTGCLTGAGSSQDEKRAIRGEDSFALRFVQNPQIGRFRGLFSGIGHP